MNEKWMKILGLFSGPVEQENLYRINIDLKVNNPVHKDLINNLFELDVILFRLGLYMS